MGTGSAIYRIVLLLHIVTAVVGFGGLLANGFNNARAYHAPAAAGKTLLEATQSVSKAAYAALYALLALGIVLVAISDNEFSFASPWVSASFVVWFAVVGVSHGMVRPSIEGLVHRADALLASTPERALDSDNEAIDHAKKLGIGEGLVQVLLVTALFLMIWKPGN